MTTMHNGRPGARELALVFLRISLLGFGGPNAHLALMLDEVVEKRRWIGREHFLHLVGVTNLLPGPNSSEVAIHVGYTQLGWRGALVTGLSFLAPTFALVVLLSVLYFRYGAIPAAEPVFWGLKPAIVAIVLGAGWKLGRTAVTDAKLLGLAVVGVATPVLLDRWEVAAMAVGGAVAWLLYRGGTGPKAGSEPHTDPPTSPPARGSHQALAVVPLVGIAIGAGEVARVFWLSLWTGSVLFGGGYMLVALLEPYVVGAYGWLTTEQFLDGIALTQAVPGPIVTFAAFVGYGVAGLPGAVAATAGIYLPSFAAVLLVAPWLERWRRIDWVKAVLQGVNAVVAGAIVGVALTLVPPAVTDPGAAALLVGALVAHFAFRVGPPWIVAAGLCAGLLKLLLG
jgi:chromate transporter